MVGMLIAASLVMCSWSIMFRDWTSRTDTRWLLSLQLALIVLASITTNFWVAFTIAWIAIHPWIAYLSFSRNLIPFSPVGSSTYQPLIPVLWWGVLYTVLKHYPVSYTVIAYTLIVWGLFNSLIVIYEEHTPSLPPWFQGGMCPNMPNAPGLVGGSFNLAFLTSAGFVSSVVLMSAPNSYTAIILLTLASLTLAFFSIRTGTLSPIIFACVVLTLWFVHDPLYIGLPVLMIGLASHEKLTRIEHKASLESRFPAWLDAIKLSKDTYFLGIGLGMWNAVTNPPVTIEQRDTEWRNLHNDWMQSIVELSPVPTLCGICLLATQWTAILYSSTLTPAHLYGLLMVSFIALYAIVYFPMRDHMPALLLAVSLSLLT